MSLAPREICSKTPRDCHLPSPDRTPQNTLFLPVKDLHTEGCCRPFPLALQTISLGQTAKTPTEGGGTGVGTSSIQHSPPQAGGPGIAGDKVPKPPSECQLVNKPWMLQIQTPCNPKKPWKSRKDGKQQGHQHEASSKGISRSHWPHCGISSASPSARVPASQKRLPCHPEPNAATTSALTRKKRGELSTRKLHSRQSTDLSELPLSIQLHPSS